MSDPWSDPRARKWKHHVEREVVPMIESSSTVVSVAPPDNKVDVKFAVELGIAIMLDKPIVVVVGAERPVPPLLVRVAAHVVVADVTTDEGREQLLAALTDLGML